ncbi:hypothetical protein Tco_0816812 [Tanacetum coccineum]
MRLSHKELGDSLVRAATTASSLEAEHESSNTTKTRSKATPNESSSQGTNSGGGPRCQETMGDTIAQTRFESVSKHSNDSLLARGNTLRSDEDRLKLDELMAPMYHLQTRVESSDDEESLGEDASKQGRIDVIDADEEITLFSVHDVNVSAGEDEVVKVINTAKLIIDVAQVSAVGDKVNTASAATTVNVATTTTSITVDDITLAQVLEEMKTTKPRPKGVVIQELGDEIQGKALDAKRAEEIRNKPPTKAQQRKIMCTYLKNMEGYKLKDLKSKGFDSIQKMFDRAFKRVNIFEDFRTELVEGKEKRAGTKLLMKIIPDEEEVAIDAIPLAVSLQVLLTGRFIKKEEKAIIK